MGVVYDMRSFSGDPFVAIDVAVHDEPEGEAERYLACVERWAA
jgi:hypothetical protein